MCPTPCLHEDHILLPRSDCSRSLTFQGFRVQWLLWCLCCSYSHAVWGTEGNGADCCRETSTSRLWRRFAADRLCQHAAAPLMPARSFLKQAFPLSGCFPSCARVSLSSFVKTFSGCGDSEHTLQIHPLCGFCCLHCTRHCPSRLRTRRCKQLHYNNRFHWTSYANRQMSG